MKTVLAILAASTLISANLAQTERLEALFRPTRDLIANRLSIQKAVKNPIQPHIVNGGGFKNPQPHIAKEYIVNGGFENPNVKSWTQFKGGVAGWTASNLEVGQGVIYNQNWGKTQVAELDSASNQSLKQEIHNLENGAVYTLTYKWAARVNRINTSGGKVFWNGRLLENIVPKDTNIHRSSFEVVGKSGCNVLEIEGTLASDSFGLTLDDFSLKECKPNCGRPTIRSLLNY